DVGVLAAPGELGEGGVGVQPVPGHQDALGLVDHRAGGQRLAQLRLLPAQLGHGVVLVQQRHRRGRERQRPPGL
ncbi:MAG: hypothetical protein AVDCRST_MAG41-4007, partial [uncultured Corynebacteriales bacterium]